MHPSWVSYELSDDLPEIAAGSMQLQPIDDTSRCGAIAALGRNARTAQAAWVARDAITAAPRAYVALVAVDGEVDVVSAPGIVGTDEDAATASEVVTRFARDGLGVPLRGNWR